mmetsp:Transcript_80682/g.195581  ORF Transcript_80682/g.195581 Transcript_80682/m.195581 type:complete len:154 (-) Transcript_80682:206-667(-)
MCHAQSSPRSPSSGLGMEDQEIYPAAWHEDGWRSAGAETDDDSDMEDWLAEKEVCLRTEPPALTLSPFLLSNMSTAPGTPKGSEADSDSDDGAESDVRRRGPFEGLLSLHPPEHLHEGATPFEELQVDDESFRGLCQRLADVFREADDDESEW